MLAVRDPTIWKEPSAPYVRDAAIWKPWKQFYARSSAVWKPVLQFNFYQQLSALSLLTNLKVCLDAGAGASLPAASTKWMDLSGNGYDFFLGATVGAEASDPTIVGTQNGRSASEYLSMDGGDYCRYDAANEAWMQNLHKAGATWTACFWFYPATLGNAIWGTLGSTSGNTGVRYGFSADGTATLYVMKAGVAARQQAVASKIVANTWNFVGISMNSPVGANGLVIQTNAAQEVFTATYSSPSTANASFTMEIGAGGNALIPLSNGSRFASAMMWEGTALSAAQVDAVYQATRGRFGV